MRRTCLPAILAVAVVSVAQPPDAKSLKSKSPMRAPVRTSGDGFRFAAVDSGATALRATPDGKITLKIEETQIARRGSTVARLCDKATGKSFGPVLHHDARWGMEPAPIRCWAFSPDGKYVATATGLGLKEDSDYTCIGDIRVWDARTGRLVATVPTPLGYVKRVAFGKDGSTVEYSALHFNIDGP